MPNGKRTARPDPADIPRTHELPDWVTETPEEPDYSMCMV